MRVIIAGSRDITDYNLLVSIIKESNLTITQIICGGATGVDALGEKYAKENNIELKYYRANWTNHGKATGPIRNRQMAENADALIAIWDGASRGTMNMISEANKKDLLSIIKILKSTQ